MTPRAQSAALLRAFAVAALTVGTFVAASERRAEAATVVGDGLVLSCNQPEPLSLRCDYRLTGPAQPLAAEASVDDVRLPAPSFAVRTGDVGSIAVLMLVDTSDPGRAPAIRAIEKHLSAMVDSAQPHQRFGLATFDSDLALLAPIGSTPEALKAAARTLQAKGHTTELYRNVLEATKLLATATDEHKALVVISDGLAEDRAYFHRDAVEAALKARITVHGIGYPRSVPLSVGLQSLRRLAEETGGRFVAADSSYELPADFLDNPLVGVQNIGALAVDLSAAAEVLPGGSRSLRVSFETSAGVMRADVPITLPVRGNAEPVVKVVEVEVPRVIEVEKVVRVPAPTAPPRRTPALPADAQAAVPLEYWVLAIGLLALALVVLLLILLVQRRATPAQPPRTTVSSRPASRSLPVALSSLACLVTDDGVDEPTPINGATFRVGRLSDNDLVLRDPSVSRHHAEIRRRRDGSFHVLDLDSMNGVFVNGSKVHDGNLAHGDVIEVGDVSMTFTVAEDDRVEGEETVMMNTAVPDEPFPEAAGGRH